MYTPLYADLLDHELRDYAAAAAALAGLTIPDAWWPGVLRNLRTLLVQADRVATGPKPDSPGPNATGPDPGPTAQAPRPDGPSATGAGPGPGPVATGTGPTGPGLLATAAGPDGTESIATGSGPNSTDPAPDRQPG